MNFDFMYSPPVLLPLSACLAMVLFCLVSSLLSLSLTRPVVFMFGLCFIGVGIFGHITFLDMLERCRELEASGNVSKDVLSRLERYYLVFAYMFPFISAAIGTNVISDALLKHHTYERSFSLFEFLKDLVQAVLIPVGLVVGVVVLIFWLIFLPVAPVRRILRCVLPRVGRWIYLRFLKLSIIARSNIRSLRGSLREPGPDDTP